MADLLTSDEIVEAIIELAREGGPDSVTARALAAKLHVSVGALYNYAGSMQDALKLTDAALIDEIISLCMQAPSGDAFVDWMTENPGVAQLLFTAQRVHLPFPPALIDFVAARSGLGGLPAGEVGRAFLAVVSSDPNISSLVLSGLSAWVAPLLDALARTVDRLEATDDRDGAATPIGYSTKDLIDATLRVISEDSAPDDAGVQARRATIEVLATPDQQWNFRSISERTELPLARLHQIGMRTDHLETAAVDLVKGALALTADVPSEERAMALGEAIAAAPESVFDDATDVMNIRTLDRVSKSASLRDLVIEWSEQTPGSALSATPTLIAEIGWLSVIFANRKFGGTVEETQPLARVLIDEMLSPCAAAGPADVESPTEIPIV